MFVVTIFEEKGNLRIYIDNKLYTLTKERNDALLKILTIPDDSDILINHETGK